MADPAVALIGAIGQAITPKLGGRGWQAFALTLIFGDGYRSTGGFAYPADGSIVPTSVDWDVVEAPVTEYLGQYFKVGEALPAALLVQFDRGEGRYDITFEDEDEDRWDAGPFADENLPEQLRPRFD